jgi:hypothetical protein
MPRKLRVYDAVVGVVRMIAERDTNGAMKKDPAIGELCSRPLHNTNCGVK